MTQAPESPAAQVPPVRRSALPAADILAAQILIVDDQRSNVQLLESMLRSFGYHAVSTATNPLEVCARHTEHNFDLILLDLNMPGLDGLELLERLLAMEPDGKLAVAVITAHPDHKLSALQAGARDFISKPFEKLEVLTRIHNMLEVRLLQKALQDDNADLERKVRRREAVLLRRTTQLSTLNERISDVEQQLVQADKLASIGLLAAGVAHEINNPIAYVSSNFAKLEQYIAVLMPDTHQQSSLNQVPSPERLEMIRTDMPDLLSEINEGITRIRKIVRSLQDFARTEQADDWQHVSLQPGIDATLHMVSNELKYKAEIVSEFAELPEIDCLPSQINQVLLNLLINAAHAMGEERGTITLRTGFDAREVWLQVSDTGCGIEPKLLALIFDPFFTTKPIGQGTGLGLSISYGIVQAHQGTLSVASVLGAGTTFTLRLPILRQSTKD